MEYPTIFISGKPKPKGSWTPVQTKEGIKFRPAGKTWAKWYDHAKEELKRRWKGPLLDGPVKCEFLFLLPRPKTVTREYPTSKFDGDVDKLLRALLDSMTSVVYIDDGQVVESSERKLYADDECGVWVTVSTIGESDE